MTKYIVYYNKSFKIYDNWRDMNDFINKNKDKCRFAKVTSEAEIKKFKDKYDGKEIINKVYVVIYNNKVNYYDKWLEAKKYINEHPKCVYKGFENKKDIEKFVLENTHSVVKNNDPNTLYAELYIDKDDIVIKYVKDSNMINKVKMRNNYAEVVSYIIACQEAIKYAISINEERIIIKSSFIGLEMFAHKAWEAKSDITKKFVQRIEEYSKKINIDFANEK